MHNSSTKRVMYYKTGLNNSPESQNKKTSDTYYRYEEQHRFPKFKELFIMKIFRGFVILLMSISILTACSSSLDPDTFNVEMSIQDDSNWWSGYGTVAVLKIRSNVTEQVEISNVSINNGQCEYQPVNFPRYFNMGQILTLKLKCGYNNVIQADIETPQGTLRYKFN